MGRWVALAVALWAMGAAGQQMRNGPQTGAELLAMCQGSSITAVGQCRIYLDAYFDGIEGAYVKTGVPAICPPDDKISKARAFPIFVAYAKSHPEVLEQAEAAVVYRALTSAFPCN